MFDRPAFKAAGKASFRRNYWLCVAVSILLGLALGSAAGSGVTYRLDRHDFGYSNDYGYGYGYGYGDVLPDIHIPLPLKPVLAVFGAVAGALALLGTAVRICVGNPLQVGACRFFTGNREASEKFEVLGAGFSKSYGNIVLTQFLKDLYTFLWALLFIVPGIVKAYSYFCVPYILAENPGMKHDRAITLSLEMMNGYKGDVFVTDLSFILWVLLNALTMGLLGIFWLNPYILSTRAEVYVFVRRQALEHGVATTVDLPGRGAPRGWYTGG